MRNFLIFAWAALIVVTSVVLHVIHDGRIADLEYRLENHMCGTVDPDTVSGKWLGACVPGEGWNNAAVCFQHGHGVIQVMDGQYPVANFAVTIYKGEVVMQLIQDGEVRTKKLWDLTEESDFRTLIPRRRTDDVSDR